MQSTVLGLLAPGKGILAADESVGTLKKRFQAIALESTETARQAYRDMLIMAPGLSQWISGVILYDETIRQRGGSGECMAKEAAKHGLVPGIKVDLGTVDLPLCGPEKMTLGLDGLRERLVEYRDMGARFTKWRAVYSIQTETPSRACMATHAEALALFAAFSQEAGMVPMVEPEVLMTGNHSLGRCAEVTREILHWVFEALGHHRVDLAATILKTHMVLPGDNSAVGGGDAAIAEATWRCLRETVPAQVPGIAFLSGGQNEVEASRRLNAICQAHDLPWRLTFSFGRALQASALKAWHGRTEKVTAAQAALLHRARCNSLAIQGKYEPGMDEG